MILEASKGGGANGDDDASTAAVMQDGQLVAVSGRDADGNVVLMDPSELPESEKGFFLAAADAAAASQTKASRPPS